MDSNNLARLQSQLQLMVFHHLNDIEMNHHTCAYLMANQLNVQLYLVCVDYYQSPKAPLNQYHKFEVDNFLFIFFEKKQHINTKSLTI